VAEKTDGLSQEEREAVKERAKELRAEARASNKRAAGEKAIREAIEQMSGLDREIAEGFYKVVNAVAPQLMPKTYYGMPAFANGDGKVVLFMQPAEKFKARYATLGFDEAANLDDGDMWPVGFAVVAWTPAIEKRYTELVTKAAA